MARRVLLLTGLMAAAGAAVILPEMSAGTAVAPNFRSEQQPKHVSTASPSPSAADTIKGVVQAAFTPGPKMTAPAAPQLEIGDELQLIIYEKMPDVEANKWGRGAGESGFQQRTEMSGKFQIGDGGLVSIPILGTFSISDAPTQEKLVEAIQDAYQKRIGRPGFATITTLLRPPIYILGPVKNPGKYDYVPGGTVLHAVALAGGIKTSDDDGGGSYHRIEKIREAMNRKSALTDMAELIAREAVLKSERDSVPPQASQMLIKIVGKPKADDMIAKEAMRRISLLESRRSQLAGLDEQVRASEQQVQTLSATNMTTMDNVIALAQRRVDVMRKIIANGFVNNVQVLQAEGELANAKRVREEIINKLAEAKQNVGRNRQQKAQYETQVRSDTDQQIIALQQQINANEVKDQTSQGILAALNNNGMIQAAYTEDANDPNSAWVYQIVRNTPKGHVEIEAKGTTGVQPGDLVRIVISGNHDGKVNPGDATPLPTNKGGRDASLEVPVPAATASIPPLSISAKQR